jgi:hypothetical protein
MTPEEQAAFMEELEEIGANQMRLRLELELSWTDSEGELLDPKRGDAFVSSPVKHTLHN